MKLFLVMLTIISALFMAETVMAGDKVNINTATTEQLQTIKGIGPKTAAAIVDYRKKHGKFSSVSDLKSVRGIGEKSLLKIKSELTAGKNVAKTRAKEKKKNKPDDKKKAKMKDLKEKKKAEAKKK